jgi:hypothetical protein
MLSEVRRQPNEVEALLISVQRLWPVEAFPPLIIAL